MKKVQFPDKHKSIFAEYKKVMGKIDTPLAKVCKMDVYELIGNKFFLTKERIGRIIVKMEKSKYVAEKPVIVKGKKSDTPMTNILGVVTTIGELKSMIDNYPDNTPFEFRNQPMQCLYEVKYGKDVIVVFQ